MNADEQQKVSNFGTAIDGLMEALPGISRIIPPAKMMWLARQGLPMGPSYLPPGFTAPVPIPPALPLTLTLMGSTLGSLVSMLGSAKLAHQFARTVLRPGSAAIEVPDQDQARAAAHVTYLQAFYQQLRTMADDAAIEVLLEVMMAIFAEITPVVEGT